MVVQCWREFEVHVVMSLYPWYCTQGCCASLPYVIPQTSRSGRVPSIHTKL